ncbi:glycosyltransferase [Arthrobacter sp.]|uniref:glycosyltransferase n=1 Tax=Arthrobacter sp. TaxID=1667 RepID=UPI0033963E32
MKSAAPGVSIIIPAFNEESVLRQCIYAALCQSVAPSEIIVVDNKSTDGTADLVRSMQDEYPDVPLILLHQDAEQGLIPTRNFGFSHATGEILGRIDADSVLEPDWVEHVQQAFADPEVMACTGPVLYYDMPMRRFGLQADDRMRRFVLKLAKKQYHFLFGSNMAIRRGAWDIIRHEVCLDKEDQLHEDIDISVHLADHALRIQYVPEMITGMSARRLEDSPKDYRYYVTRFERTYSAHKIHRRVFRVPMLIFMTVYYPAKLLRRVHQARTQLRVPRGGL